MPTDYLLYGNMRCDTNILKMHMCTNIKKYVLVKMNQTQNFVTILPQTTKLMSNVVKINFQLIISPELYLINETFP